MIEFEGVAKRYGDRDVIRGVSLAVAPGEVFVLLGESGSGKSTLLRMVNRLVSPDAGVVRVDGRDVAHGSVEALRRGIGYAIQSVGLFPHRTVAENIGTVPRLLGWTRQRTAQRVDELLHLLHLDEPGIGNRYPATLSGGQQQRVGVARALAAQPPIVLMDEPFGALDPLTRSALQANLKSLQRESGTTILFVTHDLDEAFALGDRIGVVRDGGLVQVATPELLARQPVDDGVRDFMGGDRAWLRLLAARRVRSAVSPGDGVEGTAIDPDATQQDALAAMLAQGRDVLPVQGGGRIALRDLMDRAR
jgi:osmoprotectant transport system ATP-binding protein